MQSDVSEGEEGDSSSSFSEYKTTLDEFLVKWHKELSEKPLSLSSSSKIEEEDVKKQSIKNLNVISDERMAEKLFFEGCEFERRGKVYDALQFYRKAIQLDPDVEFKFYEKIKIETNNNNQLKNSNESSSKTEDDESNANDDDNEDLSGVDLYLRFQENLIKAQYLIQKSTEPGVVTTSKHISELPTELIFYILKWVVSSQLDIKSLENCACACKGLYLCARDDEIWRLICMKVWGLNTGLISNTTYKTWREMFLDRHRIQFNGCYISKTTYIRLGENSFQDQFYRPIQLVEYFRYFRFLPDRTVIMWTTSEEPQSAVSKLKNLNQLRPEILKGNYRLHGDLVTIMLKKNLKSPGTPNNYSMKRRGSNAFGIDNDSNTYYIEFNIVNTPKKRFAQLQWKNYSILQIKNKREISTDFELSKDKYPPLWFSRVKSYHLEADMPLQ